MDNTDPDLIALMVTVGHASHLLTHDGTPTEWAALTAALESEHTPAQLANMLTGAAALIARTTTARSPNSPIL